MSRVQAGSVNASSGVTTQTTTLTGVVAAHLLELSVHWDMNAASGKPTLDSTAVSAGWLEAGTAGPVVAAGNSSWITGVTKFYLQNCPSGSVSCKVNFPATARANSQMVEYSSYATGGALDKVASNTITSGTTITATTGTTAQANELVTISVAARFVASNSNIGLSAPPAGYTQNGVLQDTNTYAAFESAFKEVTSAGAQAGTWSWTGAGEAAALVVTYGTTNAPAPTLSSPTPSGTIGTSTSAAVGATTDTPNGTLYTVVDTASLTGITGTQIKNGQNASSVAATSSGSITISSTGAITVNDTGLAANTLYNYKVIQGSASGDSNIVGGSFTTHATLPSITSLSASVVQVGSSLTLTGTSFKASQGTGSVNIDGVAQTVTSWANTSVTITVTLGTGATALGYGDHTISLTDNTGGISNSKPVTLNPPGTNIYVVVGNPDPTTAERVTASPDIVLNYQMEMGNYTGTTTSTPINMNSDGSFDVDSGMVSYDFRVWVPGSGWGSWATQTILQSSGGGIVQIGGVAIGSLQSIGGVAAASVLGVGGVTK